MRWLKIAGAIIIAGGFIFSGEIYFSAFSGIILATVGGTLMMVGGIVLAFAKPGERA